MKTYDPMFVAPDQVREYNDEMFNADALLADEICVYDNDGNEIMTVELDAAKDMLRSKCFYAVTSSDIAVYSSLKA
jgi:hypothetical protein